MKSPEKIIKDDKQHVQDKQENRDGKNDNGGGGGDPPPPPPPKVASKSKSNAHKKLQKEEPIQRSFLIPFPLHGCGWSPQGGTKRWCILNLVLVGIAIIISLANVVLVLSTSHKPEKHKLFMAFHPGVYWKCHKVLLTVDVACTFAGELVYLVACIFLLFSVLSKETKMKILLANFYLYISMLFPLGYLPRLFLLANAPCKDPNVMINFGLIVVLFTLYLMLFLWLVVGNRLVRSYILWLRNPNAEEFYRDDDSEEIDLEEGNEPRRWRHLSNNMKKETNILEFIIERKAAGKSTASPLPQSSKSSKAAVTSVPLNLKQSHTSLIEDIPSITPTTRPLNTKEKTDDKREIEKGNEKEKGKDDKIAKENDDKKKKTGLFGRIMGGLKNGIKKM